MSEQTATTHPVLACVRILEAALKDAADTQPVFMNTDEKQQALLDLHRVATRLAELQLRVLAVADDVAEREGAKDPGAWLAHHTRTEPATARADLALARALDRHHPVIGAAMAAGDVSPPQARVIIDAVQALPDDLDPEIAASAEATLLGYATDFRPSQLRRLGMRILEVVAPDIADAEEARRLSAEEEHAQQRTSLRIRSLGGGLSQLTLAFPDASAARLRTNLEAFTSPRHDEGSATGEAARIPHHRKLGEAFCALLEHLDPATLPDHGGDATTVMVAVTLDALRTDLATAQLLDSNLDSDLDSGANLTAAQARRLACTAKLIPVVLGGDSEILDLGRTRRLFTPAQRKAMRIRDQHCRGDGCTIPATWCEAHHLQPWSTGGTTDLAHGILLCNHHHHRAHDPHYRADRLPNGDLRFHRRT